jgi:type I restriction enzyme S subunit
MSGYICEEITTPTYQEQTAIAAYLDLRTAEIDNLLADLASQAEMLDTYKRELIAEAVTKGLDKSVPMKDSGVEWIGEVPAHWAIHPLYAVATENTVKNAGLSCDNLLSLSYGRIIQKDIDTNFGLLPASFEGYQIVQPGYTVLRLTDLQNDKRSLRTGYVTETGIITSAYLGLIPSSVLDSKYFTDLLHAYDLLKIYYALGSGLRQTLKFSDMKRLPVPVPPKMEQEQIAAFIDAKVAKIDGLIADINAQIEKLKQYRQIVIHDAVTGKIKVTEG